MSVTLRSTVQRKFRRIVRSLAAGNALRLGRAARRHGAKTRAAALLTQTWVSTDGQNIVVNTPSWSQKARNVAREPRVAVNIVDADDTRRYFAVRGRVVAATTEGGTHPASPALAGLHAAIDDVANRALRNLWQDAGDRPSGRGRNWCQSAFSW